MNFAVTSSNGSFLGGSVVPLEFLSEIAAGPLPHVESTEASIDKLRVLVAAGMVTADMPEPGRSGAAVVRSITALGRASIKRHVPAPTISPARTP